MLGAIIIILLIVVASILTVNLFREWFRSNGIDNPAYCDLGPLVSKINAYRKEKLLLTVTETSEWYKQVLALNSRTSWNSDILDNGHSECYMFVDSKAQFDNARPDKRIQDFLIHNRDRITCDREIIRENWDIREAYDASFQKLSSSATEEYCESLGVRYDDYRKIEEELVSKAKLSIIDSYGITCKIVYTSPHGRNRYEKKFFYDDFDIDDLYRKIDRFKEERSTEQYRRRVERGKMTPSLRYDVMKRDEFRCCLCGRSSLDNVELEVDHIIPIARGGTTEYSNLQTLCRDCNRGKGAK